MAGKNAKFHGSKRSQKRSEERQAEQRKRDAQANDPMHARDQHYAQGHQPVRMR